MRKIILIVAGLWLFILGLFMTVDIGGIDIVICPRCGSFVDLLIGVITMALGAATLAMGARERNVAM
jgi:hypothetical protein